MTTKQNIHEVIGPKLLQATQQFFLSLKLKG